jgi:hypothetical protein
MLGRRSRLQMLGRRSRLLHLLSPLLHSLICSLHSGLHFHLPVAHPIGHPWNIAAQNTSSSSQRQMCARQVDSLLMQGVTSDTDAPAHYCAAGRCEVEGILVHCLFVQHMHIGTPATYKHNCKASTAERILGLSTMVTTSPVRQTGCALESRYRSQERCLCEPSPGTGRPHMSPAAVVTAAPAAA